MSKLSTYQNLIQIGQGNYGIAYLSTNSTTGEKTVIKLIKKDFLEPKTLDGRSSDCVAHEYLSKLNLGYIPKFYKCWEEAFNQQSYTIVAMEYIDGFTLSHILDKSFNLLDKDEFTTLINKIYSQLLRVVKDLHSRGWGHGDLTNPSNIIWTHDERIYLIDFSFSCSKDFRCGYLGTEKTVAMAQAFDISSFLFTDNNAPITKYKDKLSFILKDKHFDSLTIEKQNNLTIEDLCYLYFKDEVERKGYLIDQKTNISVDISGLLFNLGHDVI